MQAQSPGELALLAQRSVRILVVDDNLQEQQILKLKLDGLGASVIQVRHGRMAIMTAQKAEPDIIILDLETSDMPGLEVLRHLKSVKRTSKIPVICLSSSRDDTLRMRAMRLHADWYLSKPFRFSEMLARLRYLAQEMAAAGPASGPANQEDMRRSMMRASVDTLSDVQDIRKALHGLKGYIGADDYYLNSKLEICFRSLVRIESRLKDFRGMTTRRAVPAARLAPFPLGGPLAGSGPAGAPAERESRLQRQESFHEIDLDDDSSHDADASRDSAHEPPHDRAYDVSQEPPADAPTSDGDDSPADSQPFRKDSGRPRHGSPIDDSHIGDTPLSTEIPTDFPEDLDDDMDDGTHGGRGRFD